MKRLSVLFTVISLAAACIATAAPGGGGDRTKTFTVGKGGTLEVTIRGGNIIINPWDRDEVSVRIKGVDDGEDPAIRMVQSGTTVRIEDTDGSSDDLTLDVSLPSRFDVRLQSSSGDIQVNGPLTGKLKGTTGGGNIRLGNLGGAIDMRTSGGDITSGDIGGDLDFNTSGGDIHMGTVSGSAAVVTSGGDITVANVGKKIRASTSGGNIAIGDVGGEAIVSTSGGISPRDPFPEVPRSRPREGISCCTEPRGRSGQPAPAVTCSSRTSPGRWRGARRGGTLSRC